jgi:spore coat protein U domain-containing protein, fimbrial subunit CupE1/2/3/6
MKKLLALAVLIGLGALAAGPALAGTDTITFEVKASVDPSCKFTIASPVDFGSLTVYNFGTQEKEGSVTVLCTAGPNYTIELNNGANADGTQRRMKQSGSANYLAYNLFQDGAHSVAWGQAADAQSFIGDGTRQVLTVYGQMDWSEPLLPSAPVGSYLDTVTATVTF